MNQQIIADGYNIEERDSGDEDEEYYSELQAEEEDVSDN